MIHEMNQFMEELEKIEFQHTFHEQFDYLINIIFKYSKIHQIFSMSYQIPALKNGNQSSKLKKLEQMHMEMYQRLQRFIQRGKQEGILKTCLPDDLILGFIFQTVEIPNVQKIPQEQWQRSVKKILSFGMFKILQIDTSVTIDYTKNIN